MMAVVVFHVVMFLNKRLLYRPLHCVPSSLACDDCRSRAALPAEGHSIAYRDNAHAYSVIIHDIIVEVTERLCILVLNLQRERKQALHLE